MSVMPRRSLVFPSQAGVARVGRIGFALVVFLAGTLLVSGCDLVLYDSQLIQGARRSQDLTEVQSLVVSDWDYQDDSGQGIAPTGWYPDTLNSSSGYLIARDTEGDELMVARVEGSAVIVSTRVSLFNSDTPDRWDAWVVPIDTTVQEQYLLANPDAEPRAPALIVARFADNSTTDTEVQLVGILRGATDNALVVREDLIADLEAAVQSLSGSAEPPRIVSVQIAGYGPGASLPNGTVTDTAGAVIQVLARNTATGQTAPFVVVAGGLTVADWIESSATTGLSAVRAGGSFVMPVRSDGERPGLIRHATLVDGGPGTVVSFRDGNYSRAPWRSFTIPAGEAPDELPTGFAVSSVTVEGTIRTARTGSIAEVRIPDLPAARPIEQSWGSLWYSGTYPTLAGDPGNSAAFEQHAATSVFTQVGSNRAVTGDSIVQVATYIE